MNEYKSLTFDNFSQAKRAAQVQQSLQAELVAAHSVLEELHAHVASQKPRDQIPQTVEALASADSLVQDKLFEQATLPGTIQVLACDKLMLSTASNDNRHAHETHVLADGGKVSDTHGCMHAEGEPHQDPYPDLDFPGAQYVRREVLEQVKRKAKADLAQLETELMAVIQAMETENRGTAGRGNGESPWLTPEFTPALRPQTAENSPSPAEVSQMTWATTRTTSPPAWRELLNTQRQRIAVESMRQEQKNSLELMNAEHNVALHGMVDDGMFDWNPVSDSKHAEMDRGSVAGEHTRSATIVRGENGGLGIMLRGEHAGTQGFTADAVMAAGEVETGEAKEMLGAVDLERETRKAREAREAIRQDALRMWGAEIEGLRQLGWSLSQSLAFSGLLCV